MLINKTKRTNREHIKYSYNTERIKTKKGISISKKFLLNLYCIEQNMDKKIIDGMEKESKVSMYLMVIGYIFAVLILLISYKSKDKGDVLLAIMWFIIGTLGLYTWLCAIK